jgi:hypothetical protein
LCEKRIQNDWLMRFGHPLLLMETFVDPQRYHGTVYKAKILDTHFTIDTVLDIR